MGKSQPQLPLNHHHLQHQNRQGSSFFVRCSRRFSRTARLFSFKCVFILLLSVFVSLSAIFSVVHVHRRESGYDARDSIKHSAKVQAYFRLEKPVSFLIPQITRLEYDINDEIGLPGTQVAILSMHKSPSYNNFTDIIFGVLSNPINSPINPVALSVLRTSLVDLFSQRSNLTLTKSIFGLTSSFEILKFSNGITIIPKLSPPLWYLPEVLFNFTLRNSLHEIEDNFLVLKEQLKSGLQLMPDENVFVQVTNKVGSTQDPPVTVQASVVKNIGTLDPERLKQLAEEITKSPPKKNLGLDNAVFGKVKEISLSSFLSHTLDAPSPSPAPSPQQQNLPESSPASSPSPASDPGCGGSDAAGSGPGPGPDPGITGRAISPNGSPLPAVSYGSVPRQESGPRKDLAPSPVSMLTSSSCRTHFKIYGWWVTILVLVMLQVL